VPEFPDYVILSGAPHHAASPSNCVVLTSVTMPSRSTLVHGRDAVIAARLLISRARLDRLDHPPPEDATTHLSTTKTASRAFARISPSTRTLSLVKTVKTSRQLPRKPASTCGFPCLDRRIMPPRQGKTGQDAAAHAAWVLQGRRRGRRRRCSSSAACCRRPCASAWSAPWHPCG